MKCTKIKELIRNYKFLSETERKRVKEHLQQCEECRSYYESMGTLFEGLDQYQIKELSRDEWAEFNDSFWEEAEKNKSLPGRILKPAASVVVVLIVLFGSLIIFTDISHRALPFLRQFRQVTPEEVVYDTSLIENERDILNDLTQFRKEELEEVENIINEDRTLEYQINQLSDEEQKKLLSYLKNWEREL